MRNAARWVIVVLLAVLCAGAATAKITVATGHLLKPRTPGQKEKRVASMFIHEDRLEFIIEEEPVPLEVKRTDIKNIQDQSGQRRASVGTMFAWGVVGAIAGKRTITTVGIEKNDGEIIIFQRKGKETLHLTIALDQFMEQLEQDGATSTDGVGDFCTDEQIAAMARAGLTDTQIKAACREGG